MLGLMLFDGFADAAGCDSSKCATVACHACACSVHVVPQGVVQVALAPVRASFIAYKPGAHTAPPLKSLFRPPCLAA